VWIKKTNTVSNTKGWELLVCAMREKEIYWNTGKDAMIFEHAAP